jgi:O-antigen ligase
MLLAVVERFNALYAIVILGSLLATLGLLLFVRLLEIYVFSLFVLTIPLGIYAFPFGKPVWPMAGVPDVPIVYLSDVLIVTLYFFWFFKTTAQRRPWRPVSLPADLPAMLILASGWLSLINADWLSLSLFDIVRLTKVTMVYLYMANRGLTSKQIVVSLALLVVSGAFEALFGIVQFITQSAIVPQISGYASFITNLDPYTPILRVLGTMSSPGIFGDYMVLIAILCISLLVAPGSGMRKILLLATACVSVVALMASMANASFVAAGVSLLVFLVGGLASRQLGVLGALFAIGATAVVGVMAVGVGQYVGLIEWVTMRVSFNWYGRVQGTWGVIRNALDLFKDNPVFGIGLHNSQIALGGMTIHSAYVVILVETGVFGLFAYLWFLIACVKRACVSVSSHNSFVAFVSLGLLSWFVGFSTHNIIDDPFWGNQMSVLFWFLCGLTTTLGKLNWVRPVSAPQDTNSNLDEARVTV